jgi:integrase
VILALGVPLAAGAPNREALFTSALAVGLRSGECGAPRWEDVDVDAGTVTVKHTLQRMKEQGLILMPPKSPKSRRTIPLPVSCVAGLKAHMERQQQERLWAGPHSKETGHMFPAPSERRLTTEKS